MTVSDTPPLSEATPPISLAGQDAGNGGVAFSESEANMDRGWVRLWRKLDDNPMARDPFWVAVWTYLLRNATHRAHDVMWCGQRKTLQPGQLILGRHALAFQTGVSESRIRRILKRLVFDQQIDQQTTNQSSLITIRNWELYQANDQRNSQQIASDRPATDQRPTTNKNGENGENGKNGETIEAPRKRVIFTPPTLQEVIDYIREKKYTFNPAAFIGYYESNGWLVGKNKMKSWRAACVTWQERERGQARGSPAPAAVSQHFEIPVIKSKDL